MLKENKGIQTRKDGRKKKKKKAQEKGHRKKYILCLGRNTMFDGRADKEMRMESANSNLSKPLNLENKMFIM